MFERASRSLVGLVGLGLLLLTLAKGPDGALVGLNPTIGGLLLAAAGVALLFEAQIARSVGRTAARGAGGGPLVAALVCVGPAALGLAFVLGALVSPLRRPRAVIVRNGWVCLWLAAFAAMPLPLLAWGILAVATIAYRDVADRTDERDDALDVLSPREILLLTAASILGSLLSLAVLVALAVGTSAVFVAAFLLPLLITLAVTPRLAHRLERAGLVAEAEALSEHRREERLVSERDQAAQDARRDELTGLLNGLAFNQDLADLSGPALLVYGDVSGLKAVNDSPLTHRGGDALLRAVARGLSEAVRDSDRVYRLNPRGDEFAVVLAAAPLVMVDELVGRLDAAVRGAIAAEPILLGHRAYLRMGTAHTDEAAVDGDHGRLVALADARLTEAWQRDHAAGYARGT